MKLKHFAGYGCVNARKLYKYPVLDENGEKRTKLVVEVKGNHEYGLVPSSFKYGDVYDVKRWIFDRFEKNFKGEEEDIKVTYSEDYVKENGLDVNVVKYIFIY